MKIPDTDKDMAKIEKSNASSSSESFTSAKTWGTVIGINNSKNTLTFTKFFFIVEFLIITY